MTRSLRATLLGLLAGAPGCIGGRAQADSPPAHGPYPVTHTDAEWHKLLTAAQYDVLRNQGTERAFTGSFYKSHDRALYRCAGCGAPLFSSEQKFDSGTGWPSYWQPVTPQAVESVRDDSHGMSRTEVRCARCGGHLGHVFPDGPRPSGLRYCINSLALTQELKK
jgi:peptide-methionine (R)-S-oxide reductase